MYGENAQAGMAQLGMNRPVPELGRLKMATERVAAASARLDGFLYRFAGPGGGESATAAPQPPESYRNDIEVLFDAISRLEMLTERLDAIG